MARHYATATVAALLWSASAHGAVIFVDASASGPTYDGASWGTAFRNPRDALDAAIDGDAIWVADGTYMPDGGFIPVGGSLTPGSWVRAETFLLKNNVSLLGGFAGGG